MKVVYFIRPVRMEGPVKIGCSEQPVVRLDALMSWSPFPLEVVATIEGDFNVERRFHGMFLADHTHKEWFRPSERLSALIAHIAAGATLAEVLDPTVKPAVFRDSSGRNPEWRRRISYVHRLRWAFQGSGLYHPIDVHEIMSRWSGWAGQEVQQPTDVEISRLEETLADPDGHGLTWEQRFSERSAATTAPKPDRPKRRAPVARGVAA